MEPRISPARPTRIPAQSPWSDDRWSVGKRDAREGLRYPPPLVLGEREAIVTDIRPWDVHGVRYVDVTVGYADGGVETARVGPESVPDDLQVGERVMVSRAVNMIVGMRRA